MMHRPALRAALLVALAATAAWPALAQYKVIGPDGRVTYTDRPPTAAGNRVLSIRQSGAVSATDGAPANLASLPQALRQPVARFPVTLITAADCAPCDSARQMLQRRGVPYSERSVVSDADQQALQQLSGALTVPSVRIGSQVLRGWLESDWLSTLDLAGYPASSALPPSWRWAAASPLAPRGAEPAAPAAAPTPPPPPPAENPGPTPNIRF
ncbi:glutaredoxin family protein [Aquabacterium sp. OR-4]|uniref:glutaredoxin family protein n=1 Tax=Aquabacterium sp. OR-4 TaxID=2978127 RepID=UPI0021B44ADB|nr:glutaredoxin family protein [Aquabacterium sp. OR-4]MDT7835158.1 glutaredoxin family protein [Aquabacterium sp. OR-4]